MSMLVFSSLSFNKRFPPPTPGIGRRRWPFASAWGSGQFVQEALNAVCNLALPDDSPFPSKALQFVTRLIVSLDVSFNLCRPVFDITFGHSSPHTTMPVPEASMNKQSDPIAGEKQIGTSRQVSAVEPVAMTCPMHRSAHLHFGARVSRLDLGHHCASGAAVYVISHNQIPQRFAGSLINRDLSVSTSSTRSLYLSNKLLKPSANPPLPNPPSSSMF